jgi:hypothetical protein
MGRAKKERNGHNVIFELTQPGAKQVAVCSRQYGAPSHRRLLDNLRHARTRSNWAGPSDKFGNIERLVGYAQHTNTIPQY